MCEFLTNYLGKHVAMFNKCEKKYYVTAMTNGTY